MPNGIVPPISDEGLFLEIVDAIRLLKMAGQILDRRTAEMADPKPLAQLGVVREIGRFLNEVKGPLAAWARANYSDWEMIRSQQPTADGCDLDI